MVLPNHYHTMSEYHDVTIPLQLQYPLMSVHLIDAMFCPKCHITGHHQAASSSCGVVIHADKTGPYRVHVERGFIVGHHIRHGE